MTPLVSVIIPTYNGERFIRRTLKSVLSQDYRNLEVLVVVDGSRDRTPQIVGSISDRRLRLFNRRKNRGIAASRNFGLRRAKGRFVCFFDHDDLMLPRAIREQVEFLKRNSHASMVCGYSRPVVDAKIKQGRGFYRSRLNEFLERLREQKKTLHFLRLYRVIDQDTYARFWTLETILTSAMIRKTVFKETGKFDENLKAVDDVDFICRFLRRRKIFFLDRAVKKYRIHGGNSFFLMRQEILNRDFQKMRQKHGS